MERPVFISYKNKKSGETSSVEFKYDALGRRIHEKLSSGFENAFLYDGCGNEILIKTAVRGNGTAEFNGLYSAVNEGEDFASVSDYSNSESVRTGVFDKSNSVTRDGNNFPLVRDYEPEKKEISYDNRTCVYLNLSGSPSVVLYPKDSDFYNSLELITSDFRGNSRVVFGADSDCSSLMEYDTWGNVIQKGKNLNFSGSTGNNFSGLLFYNLSNRDYSPEMKSFISMDPAKDGSNWFAYCACDPVNYRDSNGLEKTCMTELEKFDYAYAVLCYAYEFSILDYNTYGNSYFIPESFDCADVSYTMDCFASMYAGLENNIGKSGAFMTAFLSGNINAAAKVICSSDFFNENNTSFIKTSAGYDRNALRKYRSEVSKGDLTNVSSYISEMRNKADTLRILSNPNFISPGTVLVFRKSDTPAENDSGNWVGHTLTVVARVFNDRGDVTGFSYIEGHTNGGKTRIGFINVSPDSKVPDFDGKPHNIDSWFGAFVGTFEKSGNSSRIGGGCGK
jgi:RHS repeat-associated protein